MTVEILKRANHRNGVSGVPFDVILFADDDNPGHVMVAVSFLDEDYPDDHVIDQKRTAVLDLELLVREEIAFGENSWRGDCYAGELAPALARQLA